MTPTEKAKERRQKRAREGNCPLCGDFAYPYYYCGKCRQKQNIFRILRSFEKKGWVDTDFKDGLKRWKWNNSAPVDRKYRKYSPESIAKMQLPRLKGKPLTDDLISECILKVLEENDVPMTDKEIQRGFKSLKTIGKIVPETQQLINEYKLIQEKKSCLSRRQRDGVEMRIQFMLKRGAITQSQLQ